MPPRTGIPEWDTYFLLLCRQIAMRSRDPSTQLGAIIVGPDNEIRSTGYNSFARKIRDATDRGWEIIDRWEKPEKYEWVAHAEVNAIYHAARVGTATKGCKLYVSLMPCNHCAIGIIQAGITTVIVDASITQKRLGDAHWGSKFERSFQMFKEAGVTLHTLYVNGE